VRVFAFLVEVMKDKILIKNLVNGEVLPWFQSSSNHSWE